MQHYALVSVLVLFGCGDDTGTSPGDAAHDAPMPDAMPDAKIDAPIDAPMAQFSDGGFTTTSTPHMVQCGLTSASSCSTTTDFCCGTLSTLMFKCDMIGDTDAGACDVHLECDGPEDCAGNEVCCGQRSGNFVGVSSCKTTCDTGEVQLCHDHTECPSSTPACCTGSPGGFQLPTGYCTTAEAAPAQAMCNIP